MTEIDNKPKLIKMKPEMSEGPKFISIHERARLKNVKSYIDIQKELEKKIASQPIHFRMLHYEDEKMGRLTTAPETVKSRPKFKKPRIEDDQRPMTNVNIVRARKIDINMSHKPMSSIPRMFRSGSTGDIDNQIVYKKKKYKPFPQDFALENTLVSIF